MFLAVGFDHGADQAVWSAWAQAFWSAWVQEDRSWSRVCCSCGVAPVVCRSALLLPAHLWLAACDALPQADLIVWYVRQAPRRDCLSRCVGQTFGGASCATARSRSSDSPRQAAHQAWGRVCDGAPGSWVRWSQRPCRLLCRRARPMTPGSTLSCDLAGRPLGRAGRFGGRPGCGRGVAGMGCCV